MLYPIYPQPKGSGFYLNVKREIYGNYGCPRGEFSDVDSVGAWERQVFAGIDLRFENGETVRIGIPGRQRNGPSDSVVEFLSGWSPNRKLTRRCLFANQLYALRLASAISGCRNS